MNVDPSQEESSSTIAKTMSMKAFYEVLKAHNYPLAASGIDKSHVWFIFKALDFHGCGFIFRSDCEWLDAWKATEWLVAEPDEASWTALRTLLLRKHGHLLNAWRDELDRDNSNRLSWNEFQEACERLKFQGDMGAAWRWLDTDLCGWISLTEVDEESSNMLMSFKEWAEHLFGTIQLFFKGISEDGRDSITYSELRSACLKFKWSGNARVIFECLSENGDTVSYKNCAFLSSWTPKDEENMLANKKYADTLWAEILASRHRGTQGPNRQGSKSTTTALLTSSGSLPSLSSSAKHVGKSISSLPQAHCSPWPPQFSAAPYALPLQQCKRAIGPGCASRAKTSSSGKRAAIPSSKPPGNLNS